MYLPTFPRRMAAVRHVQTDFRGYDHRPSCPEGGIYEMTNGSAADSPLFSTRPGRTCIYPCSGTPNGLFAAGDGLLWCAGTALYYNGKAVPGCTLTDTPKVFAALGGTVLIWPDKVWFRPADGTFGSAEPSWSGSVTLAGADTDGDGRASILVADGAGAEQPLTDATFVPLLQSGDRTLRRNAFETYYATLGGYRNTLAATLDAQFKQLRFFANARRYPSTLDAALFALFDIGMERLGLRCLNSFFEFYLPELFPGKLTVYIAAFAGLAALVGWVLLLCGKRAGVTVIFAVSVLPFFKSILIFLTSILALFSAADLGAQALAFAKDFVTFVTAGLPIVLMLFWKGRGY